MWDLIFQGFQLVLWKFFRNKGSAVFRTCEVLNMTVQFEITRSRNYKSLPSSPKKWKGQVKYFVVGVEEEQLSPGGPGSGCCCLLFSASRPDERKCLALSPRSHMLQRPSPTLISKDAHVGVDQLYSVRCVVNCFLLPYESCGLRRRSTVARLLRSWGRIPPGGHGCLL